MQSGYVQSQSRADTSFFFWIKFKPIVQYLHISPYFACQIGRMIRCEMTISTGVQMTNAVVKVTLEESHLPTGTDVDNATHASDMQGDGCSHCISAYMTMKKSFRWKAPRWNVSKCMIRAISRGVRSPLLQYKPAWKGATVLKGLVIKTSTDNTDTKVRCACPNRSSYIGLVLAIVDKRVPIK